MFGVTWFLHSQTHIHPRAAHCVKRLARSYNYVYDGVIYHPLAELAFTCFKVFHSAKRKPLFWVNSQWIGHFSNKGRAAGVWPYLAKWRQSSAVAWSCNYNRNVLKADCTWRLRPTIKLKLHLLDFEAVSNDKVCLSVCACLNLSRPLAWVIYCNQ